MAEHVIEWLGAYHDGELRGARLRQVEQHLAECAACRAELAGMQGLSALLHETAPAGGILSTDHFIANLTLNLPRQPMHTQPRRMLEIGWWLIPVGLLGTWLFLAITFSLSDVATLITGVGLLGKNSTWLQNQSLQMEWFATMMTLFGNQIGLSGQVILSGLNEAHVFITELTDHFLWQVLLAGLYLGWLASWWLRHPRQPSQNPGSFSRS